MSSYYQRNKYAFDESEVVPEPRVGIQKDHHVDSSLYEEYQARSGDYRVEIFRSLSSKHDHTGAFLAHMLDDPKSQALLPLTSIGTFFCFIPSRIGRNLALDDAMSCLCGIYIDTLTDKPTNSESAFRRYAKSLNSLQVCVKQPQLRRESETICASIILQLCELMMNADNGRWSNLSQGSKVLMQECGPAKYNAPFERAMLESQRPFFIMQDKNAGRDCFLSQPRWKYLLRSPAPTANVSGPPSLFLRSQLCDFLVDLPDLLSQISNLSDWGHKPDSREFQEQYRWVLQHAVTIRDRLEAWYTTELEPRILACDANSSIDENASLRNSHADTAGPFEYPEILLGVLDCVTNSALIKLEQSILRLRSGLLLFKGNPDIAARHTVIARRQAKVCDAYQFVKNKSKVAAKPLKFGLQQLGSSEFVFNEMTVSPTTVREIQ